MVFSEFLDSIEGTEKEQIFISFMAKSKDALAEVPRIPFLGKVLSAIAYMANCESISEFRQSEHYEYLKDWNVGLHDIDKGHLSIYPSNEILLKIFKVISLGAAGFGLLLLCRKLRRRRLR